MAEMAPEKQAEFDKFKVEGYKNPDGSSFDPDTSIYTRGKDDKTEPHSFKVASLEEAFKFKSAEAVPYKEAEKEAARAEVKNEAAGAKVELKTVMSLDNLKDQMKDKFVNFSKEVEVESQKIQGDFTLDKNFSDAAFDAMGEKVKTELMKALSPSGNKDRFQILVKAVNDYVQKEGQSLSADDVSMLLASLYSASAKGSLKKKFDELRLGEFAKKTEKSYGIHYEVAFDKGGLSSNFTPADASFNEEYQQYLKDNPKAVDANADAANKARLDRAKKFRSSFAGKMMGTFGLVKLEEPPVDSDGKLIPEVPEAKAAREARNDQLYSDVLKGDNFIAKWFIFIFGGGAMLDGGVADIEASIKDMDPKYRGILNTLQKIASNSPLSLKKTAEQLAAPAAEILGLDKGKFAEAVKDSSKIPEKTFKLTEGFDGVEGQKLVVTLKDGAEMVLPKGQKIRANDKDEVAGEKDDKGNAVDRTFKDVVLNVTGAIPAGTTFRGKVQFKQEKMAG